MMYGLGVPVVIRTDERQHDLSVGIPQPVSSGARVRAGGAKLRGHWAITSFPESGRRKCYLVANEANSGWRCPRVARARSGFFARMVWSRMSGDVQTICQPDRTTDCVWLSWDACWPGRVDMLIDVFVEGEKGRAVPGRNCGSASGTARSARACNGRPRPWALAEQ